MPSHSPSPFSGQLKISYSAYIHTYTLISSNYFPRNNYIYTCIHCNATLFHHIHRYIDRDIHTSTNTYIHTYIHTSIHTYIHTYIDTYRPPPSPHLRQRQLRSVSTHTLPSLGGLSLEEPAHIWIC